eukprot:766942-Hanusia_phi.AAC.1
MSSMTKMSGLEWSCLRPVGCQVQAPLFACSTRKVPVDLDVLAAWRAFAPQSFVWWRKEEHEEFVRRGGWRRRRRR